ncbi:MAG: ATP-dependent DNA helicase RecG [Candidatus Palauibacterales bacterium]|nr:ATP-dependent DNA helicase RecG [Candidatus Palauibacterales bacterium]
MSQKGSPLYRPIQYLKGVGPSRSEKFARLDVRTGGDLLYHVPHRYEDATTLTPISSLHPGDEATVVGRVVSKGVIPTQKGLRIFRAVIRDDSGVIECAWPGQPWLQRSIDRGDLLLVSGPVKFFHGRQIQPREFTTLEEEGDEDGAAAGGGEVFPVYPATEGLSHRQIRSIVRKNLDELLDAVEEKELFGEAWRSEVGVPHLRDALETLHRPDEPGQVESARRRLAYEELFFLQLMFARARERVRTEGEGRPLDAEPDLTDRLRESLPFELTGAQERAWAEIRGDMESPERMYRLLQGDVGSGKTVVAALAMARAVENGTQAALMAPTEILAEQHARTLAELLEPLGLEAILVTGSLTDAERRDRLAALADGTARVVVGTHALIQEGVEYDDLGLAVVDEQHRFGVEQRRTLREAGRESDTLVMSATPIPRSLALSLYGDLDLSVIDEMPPGRKEVVTGVRGPESREAAFDFLRQKLGEGRQGFVVYPLVEESESLDARSATEMRDRLAARFPEFEVGLLHGRMSAEEKEAVMRRFLDREIQLLAATTVIEVGIDVPNATVMFIEDAERFGLAQLHQLRGRVGRGGEQAYCVAFTEEDPPPERLAAFAATTDGFELARADLRLRGQGDFFGREQHGVPELKFAELERDDDLLRHARERARRIVREDPGLSSPEHRELGRELVERYGDREELYEVG